MILFTSEREGGEELVFTLCLLFLLLLLYAHLQLLSLLSHYFQGRAHVLLDGLSG
jgi:hypothetical protein